MSLKGGICSLSWPLRGLRNTTFAWAIRNFIRDIPEGVPDINIQPLNLNISNPPTQMQVQTIVERFNELLDALKRA